MEKRSIEKYKGFLLEIVRNKLLNYFKYYKSVYSSTVPITTDNFKLNYSLNSEKSINSVVHAESKIIINNESDQDKSNDMQNYKTLNQIKSTVANCKLCDLYKTRINTVPGAGSDTADLVIIGEAPGAEEDKTGLPFVGRSGKLLTKMLEAIDLSREDVFICNVLKCRPPNNRDPKTDEIKKCSKYLERQLEILKPKYILALGRIAAKRILEIDLSMKDFRKELHSYKNIPVMVTYHPSALLRNPKWKYDAWEDLKKLRSNLNN